MPAEVITAVTILMAVMIVSLSAQWRRARQSILDRQLLERGVLTTGKVVAINRPIGLPYESHVYFTFEVPGRSPILRSCCVDMRALREQHALAIPNVGTQVPVRYLPHAPSHAVIAQLMPCLVGFTTPAARTAAGGGSTVHI